MSETSKKINQARSRLANEVKKSKTRDSHEVEGVQRARAELAEAKLEQYIAEVVAQAPGLTVEQRDRRALLLRPGGEPK